MPLTTYALPSTGGNLATVRERGVIMQILFLLALLVSGEAWAISIANHSSTVPDSPSQSPRPVNELDQPKWERSTAFNTSIMIRREKKTGDPNTKATGNCGATIVNLSNLASAGRILSALNFPLASFALNAIGRSKKCFIVTAAHCLFDEKEPGSTPSGKMPIETPYLNHPLNNVRYEVHPNFYKNITKEGKDKNLIDDIAFGEPSQEECNQMRREGAPEMNLCATPATLGDRMRAASQRGNTGMDAMLKSPQIETDLNTQVNLKGDDKAPGINVGDSGSALVKITGDSKPTAKNSCLAGVLSSKPVGTDFSKEATYSSAKDLVWIWGKLIGRTIGSLFPDNRAMQAH